MDTSSTYFPYAGGDVSTPFGNTIGSIGKKFQNNDQHFILTKYDYYVQPGYFNKLPKFVL